MHDAHCHPYDLARKIELARKTGTDTADTARDAARIMPGVPCVASAWGQDDFSYNESLSKNTKHDAPPVFLSFGVHPQLLALDKTAAAASLALFAALAQERRLDAAGEIGFD
jgi:Tat protein secretion system quality control protein TatD with DNase activity